MINRDNIGKLEDIKFGFSKHLISEVEAYINDATTRLKNNSKDNTIQKYTYFWKDKDPLYCWTIEEANFICLKDSVDKLELKTKDQAISEGMIEPLSVI